MFTRSLLSRSIAATIALSSAPMLTHAQGATQDEILEEVVVTGIRSSLNKAIDVKRDSMQVMDSIVAEDIGKLPDNNVVESLQRVSGVQVTDRGAGEVNAVSIRGLTDVSTTVNGRTIFTASGRAVELADIPSSLVTQIDVIKSRSAAQYENGIAGQIDVSTARPFDFDGAHATLNGRLVHQEQADKTDPVISALFSNTWSTNSGEFGALVNVSQTNSSYRDQSVTAGAQLPFMTENPADGGWAPLQRIPLNDRDPSLADVGITVDEDPIWQPGLDNGLPTDAGSVLDINGEPTEYYLSRDAVFASDLTGERERPAANIALQFAPDDSSEYTFEAFYNGFRDESFNSLHFAFVDFWGELGDDPADTFETYEGTNVIRSRTIGNGFTFGSGDYTESKTDTYLYALSGDWDITDDFRLNSELVYQESDFESEFVALRTTNVRHQTHADFDDVPGLSFGDDDTTPVDESDLTDASQFAMAEMYDSAEANSGSAFTFTADGEYDIFGDFLQTVRFGIRYDDREAEEFSRDQDAAPCEVINPDSADVDPDVCSLDSYDGIAHINSGFMDGRADVPDSWMVTSGPYLLNNRRDIMDVYGLDADQALRQEFAVDETNTALYVTSDFETDVLGLRLDGELGFRYVDVQTDTTFYDQQDDEVTEVSSDTSELLTNLALRYHLRDDLLLRFSYGETLRMPTFNDLNPTITYFDDITNVGYGTAESGNANLQATTSQNLDLSLEWYFGDASSLYVTLFERDIDGLVVPLRSEVSRDIDGFEANTFIYSQPENASSGTLSGVELGAVYFPDNLPGYWDGLGVQASFTALDSEQTLPVRNDEGEVTGSQDSPIFGVSDTSYSISVAYERETFDARLSYVWRDDFLNENEAASFANPLGIYRDAERSLDLQVSYNATDDLTLTLDATNLTDDLYQSSYGNSDLHSFGSSLYSRTFALGARYTF